jgi:penicillin-binding protein 1A
MLNMSHWRWVAIGLCVILCGIFVMGAAAIYAFWAFGRDLPDHSALATYQPPLMTRVYAADGRMLQEYAVEGRVFVPIDQIPKRILDAFISAEDQHFYSHNGIDFVGIMRAVTSNVEERLQGNDRRMQGASTITQQVAQNFLLGKEYSYTRKIREAILSVRIEQEFTKEHILELYINEIYLGFGSYGVAAAAMNYFNKSLDELTLGEAAFLAALPKAPNNYHPLRNPDAARERRNYVITRMLEDGHITAAEAEAAKQETIGVRSRDETQRVVGGEYFAEEVRRELAERYGDDSLYKGGLVVRTSMDPYLQFHAERVLQDGLIHYDRRHGWRGPVAHVSGDLRARLKETPNPAGMPVKWQLAAVESVTATEARILLKDGTTGQIPLSELTWARKVLPDQRRGEAITKASQVLKQGDIVMVANEKRPDPDDPAEARMSPGELPAGTYGLRQIPDVQGAVIVMDPHTGRVLALSGGFSYGTSEFDRATQALRQPGSAFKPFVYLAAMENGYTPATLVLDAPFVLDQGPGLPKWKPKNYSGEFLGLSTLRAGLEKSQNLMTVRLAQAVGMDKVADAAQRLGVVDKLPTYLAMSLGAESTTPLRMATAYAALVNGGYRVIPTLIDRVQDRNGKTIYRYDQRPCPSCMGVAWSGQEPPQLTDTRPRVTDAASAYQIVHMLEGVVERGTGTAARAIGKPVAGKTGTSNDAFDNWFMGFTPDMVVGMYIGFDEPRTLGARETGGSNVAPMFRDFMIAALKDKPATPFRVPEGISFVRINHATGKPAQSGDRVVILEAFKPDTSPFSQTTIMGVSADAGGDAAMIEVNTPDQPSAGGLY